MAMSNLECDALIKHYTARGYTVDCDDEERLCFSKYVDEETEWFKDYYKKENRFIAGNARQIVNLRSTQATLEASSTTS